MAYYGDLIIDMNAPVREEAWAQVVLWAVTEIAADVQECMYGGCRLCHRAQQILLIHQMAIV